MKSLALILILLAQSIQTAHASIPCESTVLTIAIERLLDSDNCQTEPCHLLTGKVSRIKPNIFETTLEYNSSGSLEVERYEEKSLIKVQIKSQGCQEIGR